LFWLRPHAVVYAGLIIDDTLLVRMNRVGTAANEPVMND